MGTHDWLLGASPMQTASSANWTCRACLSIVECTATQGMPISWAVRMIRTAISPLFATNIFSNSQVTDKAPLCILPLLLLLAATEEALPTACFKERHPAPLWKLLQLLCTLFGAATSGQDDALTEELHWRRLPSIDAATNRVPCQHTHTQKRNPHQLSLSLYLSTTAKIINQLQRWKRSQNTSFTIPAMHSANRMHPSPHCKMQRTPKPLRAPIPNPD